MNSFLPDLIRKVPFSIEGTPKDITVTDILQDSRKVTPTDIFIALEGFTVDGHRFIHHVIEKGCQAVIANKGQKDQIPLEDHPYILWVDSTREILPHLCNAFYDYPTKKVVLIGITGTNGKTTTTFMIRDILMASGLKVGVIGTIAYYINREQIESGRTTPEANDIYRLVHQMVTDGCQAIVMEVSSHALALNRVDGFEFDTLGFTNLTQDHLDFHETMDEYLNAKLRGYEMLSRSSKPNRFAVVNGDMDRFQTVRSKLESLNLPYYTYGLKPYGIKSIGLKDSYHFSAEQIHMTLTGTEFELIQRMQQTVMSTPIQLGLSGEFNVYNALGTIALLAPLNVIQDPILLKTSIQTGLQTTKVPGRFERVPGTSHFSVFVDYAHTPDALLNILKGILALNPKRMITVFGCGGDRDRKKRKPMGEIATAYSDWIIATSDNPRSEDPESILDEVEEGIDVRNTSKIYHRISLREKAIEFAIQHAEEGDAILIAGKGHENYQILKDRTIHFDDVEVAATYIRNYTKTLL